LTLTASVSGTDGAIDKLETALSSAMTPALNKKWCTLVH